MNHVRHWYVMGRDRCVIGVCDNDKRCPDRFIKHSNVKEKLTFHKLPADPRNDSASHMEVDSFYKCKATCTSQLVLGVVPRKFAQITKDSDVLFVTGLDGSKMFETGFEYVREKQL